MFRKILQTSLTRGVIFQSRSSVLLLQGQNHSFTRFTPRIVPSRSYGNAEVANEPQAPIVPKHHSELKKELIYCDKILDGTRAYNAVKEYWAQGHQLDIDDYETLLKLLYKRFKGDRSWEVWQRLCQDAELDPKMEPKLVHYDQALFAIGAAGLPDEVAQVLARMEQKNIKKESTTYEALITNAFKSGNPDEALQLITEYQNLYDKKEISGYWPYVRYLGYAANALQIQEVSAFTVDQMMDAFERRFDVAEILKNDSKAAYILKLVKFLQELELEDDAERVHSEIDERLQKGTQRSIFEQDISQPF